MNLRAIALRTPFVLALAAIGATLTGGSSLLQLFPFPLTWPMLFGGLVVVLLPALFTRGSPLGAVVSILVPAVAAASYQQSHLDWLRLLKDFELVSPGPPDMVRLLLALTLFALTWAMHAADHAARLSMRAVERGVSEAEAHAASRRVLSLSLQRGALALGATGVLVLVGLLASVAGLDRLLAGRSALLAPLLAAGLVAAAAYALTRAGSNDA